MERFLIARIPILGAFAGLELSHNPGIAFGVQLPPGFQTALIIIALIVVVVVAVRSVKSRENRAKSKEHYLSSFLSALYSPSVAFGLIIGGALANVIDRLPDGLVTDFIQVGTFPTFNVADSCITVGVVLLLGEMTWKESSKR